MPSFPTSSIDKTSLTVNATPDMAHIQREGFHGRESALFVEIDSLERALEIRRPAVDLALPHPPPHEQRSGPAAFVRRVRRYECESCVWIALDGARARPVRRKKERAGVDFIFFNVYVR